jgi:arylformamidase
MNNWIYLSYELAPELSNYGGSTGIEIEWLRRMDKGDTSNNSALKLSSHTGTHIDYPLHFFKEGKTGSDYKAAHFVFTKVGIINITQRNIADYLISSEDLENNLSNDIDFLIIKTGFCNARNEEKYWKYNWGFAPETATYLKTRFPDIRAIGFDCISLSAYQQREIGRIAHKEFLEKNDLLIIEDLDLRYVDINTHMVQLIIAPLRFTGADGAPVTIMAELK